MIGTVIFIFILVFVALTNSKIRLIKKRNNSEKIEAEVVEYRREKSSMRNDYTLLNYPYVKIKTENGESILTKLSHADNYSKPFEIGEKIPVFWYSDKLLYWNVYDKGIYKYLPESWSI